MYTVGISDVKFDGARNRVRNPKINASRQLQLHFFYGGIKMWVF